MKTSKVFKDRFCGRSGRISGKNFIKEICRILGIESEGVGRLKINVPACGNITIDFYDRNRNIKTTEYFFNLKSNDLLLFLDENIKINTKEMYNFVIDADYDEIVALELSYFGIKNLIGQTLDYLDSKIW